MSRTILIQDPDPVSRTRLRARLQAEAFHVVLADEAEPVGGCARTARAALILISGPGAVDRVRALKDPGAAPAAPMPVLLLGGPDTSAARFRALDAGADDVMPAPVCESLLLARVRSLMRRGPALWGEPAGAAGGPGGFHEARTGWIAAPRVALLSPVPQQSADLAGTLQAALSHRVRVAASLDAGPRPELVVIDARLGTIDRPGLSDLLAQVRATTEGSAPATLVVCDRTDPDLAAAAFDLGADDVVVGPACGQELSHRAGRLLQAPARSGIAGRAAASARLASLRREGTCFTVIRVTRPAGVDAAVAGDADEISAILQANLRAGDCVARVSADRWLCLLPVPDAEIAAKVALRLDSRLAAAGLVLPAPRSHLLGAPATTRGRRIAPMAARGTRPAA